MRLERRRVDASGMTFDILAMGPAEGEPVILLHGFPQGPGSWTAVMRRLAAEGYRAIAPAQRGYSPGANPPGAAAYGLDALAGDVVAIASGLGIRRFHLAGHDWGGAAAWSAAALHPERVMTLAAVSTPHPRAMLRALRETTTQRVHSSYMLAFQVPVIPELLLGRAGLLPLALSVRFSGLPGEAWQRDAAVLRRVGLTGPLNWYRGVRAAPASRAATGIVRVPTLYVWGRSDGFLTRAAAERTAAQVRAPYRFEPIEAGHWIPDRNAGELSTLLIDHIRRPRRSRRS
jgi:pimeloyl-ACP methyl ester carboxylesterase